MTTAPIEFELLIKGQDEVKSALEGLEKRLAAVEEANNKVEKSSSSLKKANDDLSKTSKDASQGFSKFGSVMSQANGIMGQMGGEAGRVVSGISSMAGAITSAAGPIGIFTAAATAMASGILAIKTASDEAKEHLEQLARSAMQNARDLRSNISFISGAEEERALQERVRTGKGADLRELKGFESSARQLTVALKTAQDARLEQLRELQRTAQLEFDEDNHHLNASIVRARATIERLKPDIERGRADVAAAQADLDLATENIRRFQEGRPITGGGTVDKLKAIGEAAQGATAHVETLAEAIDRAIGEARDAAREAASFRDFLNSLIPPEPPPKEARKGAEFGIIDKLGQQQESEKDRQLREMKELVSAAGEAGTKIAGVFGSAFTAALNGQKAFGKAVRDGFRDMLAGLAVSETVKSIGTLAEAMAASSNPATAAMAPELYASAATHAKAAAVAAAGAAVIGIASAASGGGGSGGGGRPSPSAGMRSGDSGANRNITINMNAPVLTAGTYADVGRTVKQVLQDAENKYGA